MLNEEYWHRQYAERDLAVLEGRDRADRLGATQRPVGGTRDE